jgi:hypothetical protein
VAEGYEFSQYQTIRTIDLYHNSKFTTGNKNGLGLRETVLRHQQIPYERRHSRYRHGYERYSGRAREAGQIPICHFFSRSRTALGWSDFVSARF